MSQGIQEYLDLMIKMKESRNVKPYSGIEDFVKTNGRAFISGKYPDKYLKYRGQKKMCFKNAFDLSQIFPELRYVEGFGFSELLPLAIFHAFCVDKKGNVIDPTWEYQDRTEYFGVELNQDYVVQTVLKTRHYGILENHRDGFPLLMNESGHRKKDFGYEKSI